MKKMLLCIMLFPLACKAMQDKSKQDENLQIAPAGFFDIMESWKKTFIGEPQYNDTLRAILNADPGSLTDNSVTNEHNLDRLLRYLVTNKNLLALSTILPKLAEQKNTWQPGNQARETVAQFINILKNGLIEEANYAQADLEKQIKKLEEQKKTLETQKKAALFHLVNMQRYLNELGSNILIEGEPAQMPDLRLEELIAVFKKLQKDTI